MTAGEVMERILRVNQTRTPVDLVCQTCGDRLEFRGDVDREWLARWGFAVLA